MLSADNIGMGSNNAILVGGAGMTMEALDRAREMKVSGIIVGGINSSLHDLMPPLPFPIVATEGYGNLPMSPIVFDMLKKREGHETSISGYMGEPHDATRPSIIVPMIGQQQEDDIESLASDVSTEPAKIGHRVRVVRGPLLGQVGEITSLTVTPQPMPSGLSLPGAQINVYDFESPSAQHETISTQEADSAARYPSSTAHFVPWLNLERID
jgi:hypothetical protein